LTGNLYRKRFVDFICLFIVAFFPVRIIPMLKYPEKPLPEMKNMKGDLMKKSVFILMAVFFTASVMVVTALAEDKDTALVTSKCTVCHKIEKVCGQIGEKTPDQWAATVKRMAEKKPGISDAEQKQIANFLSNAKDKKVLCKE
jgi:Quinohemoprotein amine dehydrogenase A, alpha subunit, haem binding